MVLSSLQLIYDNEIHLLHSYKDEDSTTLNILREPTAFQPCSAKEEEE